MDLVKHTRIFGVVVVLTILGGCAGQMQEDGLSDQATTSSEASSGVSGTSTGAGASNVEGAEVVEQDTSSQSSGANITSVSGSEVEKQQSLKEIAKEAALIFYFDFDRSDLKAVALDDLDAHARYLASDSNVRIRLEGHADERGTRAYNLALGERRANAVVRYLVIQGVNRDQIETISYGEERPASLIRDESGWSKNRRVELVPPY